MGSTPSKVTEADNGEAGTPAEAVLDSDTELDSRQQLSIDEHYSGSEYSYEEEFDSDGGEGTLASTCDAGARSVSASEGNSAGTSEYETTDDETDDSADSQSRH